MFKRFASIMLSLLMLASACLCMPASAFASSKPAQVSSLKASASCSRVNLKWKKQNAAGYQVFVSKTKNGKYKLAKTVTKNRASLKLKCGNTRFYKVRAFNKKGKKKLYGRFSKVKKAKTAHSPSTSWTIVKQATCAQTGVKKNVCSFCKKTFTEAIPVDPLAHYYVKELITGDPVYEDYSLYTCTICGDKYTSRKKEHKFVPTVTAPTCTERGYTTYKCTKCDFTYVSDFTDIVPHTYEIKSVAPNCTDAGYTVNVCSVCGYTDEQSKTETDPPIGTAHNFETKTVAPTCTEKGFTAEICTLCGYYDEASVTDIVAELGHDFEEEYTVDEEFFRHHNCTRCSEVKIDKTCYIDIANETVSNPNYAAFKKSSTNTGDYNDKLDLSTNEDGSIDFEIIGERSDFTIDINAVGRTEVKLNSVSLNNNGRDCINVKNRAPSYDENGEIITNDDGTPVYGEAPKVFISAKDLSENTLVSETSGNAIDSSCPLELRGHGKLTLKTAKTAIDNKAKLVIKNLTLDITSENRGIDTKDTVLVPGIGGAMVEDETYYNIEIEANADIRVLSADDCIRCKNMTVFELGEGHTASVINLRSTMGDGIQLEGNKGFSAASGDITINAKKYAFNCAENLIEIKPPAVVNVTGGTYAKPAE